MENAALRDQSYDRDNRVISRESSYWPTSLLPAGIFSMKILRGHYCGNT